MKISKIKLGKNDYPMCLSMLAIQDIIEQFGGMDKMSEKLDSDDVAVQLRSINEVIKILVNAGIQYAKAMDIETPDELAFEPSAVLDLRDRTILSKIKSAMIQDQETTVKARPPKNSKNAEATQGD